MDEEKVYCENCKFYNDRLCGHDPTTVNEDGEQHTYYTFCEYKNQNNDCRHFAKSDEEAKNG